MTTDGNSFGRQIQRNAVALISLLVALSSLSYNTWRNEKTEANRNERVASFEILTKLGELQQVIFHLHYDKDTANRGNPRIGWSHALTIRDLSRVLPPPLPVAGDELLEVWSANWDTLENDKASLDATLGKIEETRSDILALLRSLE